MTTPLLAVYVAVLTVWAVLSVACQFHCGAARRVRAHDVLHLVPLWTFFAPRPMTVDYLLLYRDVLEDGQLTPWTELELVRPRAWHDSVWHPGRRAQKTLVDVVKMLAVDAQRRIAAEDWEGRTLAAVPAGIQASLAYVLLVDYVSRIARLGAEALTQFAVMASTPGAGVEPVFVSGFHRLRDDAPALHEVHEHPAPAATRVEGAPA